MQNVGLKLVPAPNMLTVLLSPLSIGTTGDSFGLGQYSAANHDTIRLIVRAEDPLVDDQAVIDYPEIKRDSRVMQELKRTPA